MKTVEPTSQTQGSADGAPYGCGSGCIYSHYFGHPNQMVAPGGDLVFSRYYPTSPAGPGTTLSLPKGTYLITYGVNASPAPAAPAASKAAGFPVTSATLGLAPKINGEMFPRGGTFATVPLNTDIASSAALSTSFIAPLSKTLNTIGFYNTSKEPFATDYQLLNVTVTRVC